MTMLSELILHRSLGAPLMMTNLYPFLMGQSALKHEHIPEFPDVPEPENCILTAHCGYLGVVPESFSTEWALKPKVLAIVDDNATAIDARLPLGDITLAKISPTLERITVMKGTLESYVQYPDSDCLNGAVIRVKDGRQSIKRLDSHHYLLMTGHHLENIELLAKVFGLRTYPKIMLSKICVQAMRTKASQFCDFLHQRVATLRRFDSQQNVLSTTQRLAGKLFSPGMGHSSLGSFRLRRCLICAM